MMRSKKRNGNCVCRSGISCTAVCIHASEPVLYFEDEGLDPGSHPGSRPGSSAVKCHIKNYNSAAAASGIGSER